MRPLTKLLAVSLLTLPMFFSGAREVSAGVCEDRRDFCLAGCTSSSPSNCRSKCLAQYVCCTGERQCPNTPIGGGGDP